MAKVYIVTRPTENKFGWTPDLSDAARYGTLCVLYEPDERPQFHPNKAIKIMYCDGSAILITAREIGARDSTCQLN